MRAAVILALALLASACGDSVQHVFLSSIPFHAPKKENAAPLSVLIAVDGVSHETLREAQKLGAFRSREEGGRWSAARSIAPFPGTSDYSWTRILKAPPIQGYEATYFDHLTKTIVNDGLLGVLKHGVPAFTREWSFEPPYVQFFKYRANGFFHTMTAYGDTHASLSESMDTLFDNLEGRVWGPDVFSAYILELDVLGHTRGQDEVLRRLVEFVGRIEEFRARHPERELRFTLVSDHGMDFTAVPKDHFVRLDEEFARVGIRYVDRLPESRPSDGSIPAVPILHVFVTYVSVNTLPELASEVATRLSRLESVDLALASDHGAVEVWSGGDLALKFEHVRETDRYRVLEQKAGALGLAPLSPELSAQEAWQASLRTEYPDLFFRLRTAFETGPIYNPAEVLVSMRRGYVSQGFRMTGDSAFQTTSGFHGSLHEVASSGILVTEERELPDTVRADELTTLLLPKFAETHWDEHAR